MPHTELPTKRQAKLVNHYERALSAHEIMLHYLLEVAWQLIEKASGGMMDLDQNEWIESAAKWHDDWLEELEKEKERCRIAVHGSHDSTLSP